MKAVESEVILWNVVQVSQAVGLSIRSVWRMADSGQLPRPLCIGGARRWRRQDILDWADAGCPPVRTAKHGPTR